MNILVGRLPVAAVMGALLVSCECVDLRLVGCAVVDEQSPCRAVYDQYGRVELPQGDGEHLVCWIAADVDLEPRAKALTHHLWFSVGPIQDDGVDLWSGHLARVDEVERDALGGAVGSDEWVYKLFIPTDFETLVRHAQPFTRDMELFLAQCRKGLFVRVGGGKIWGASLSSNAVPIPLQLVGATIQLDEESIGS